MSDRLPVLVADLADEAARNFLDEVAQSRGEAWVPLLAAPADASRHVLEVYTPGAPEPLRLLADPLGAPSAEGFPLRLSPLADDDGDDDQEETWTAASAPVTRAAPPVSARRDTPTATFLRKPAGPARRQVEVVLSPEHTADLAGGEPPAASADPLVGRTLASGKLEIQSLVGKGLMGAVYRARHVSLGVPIAVKVMHEALQRDVDFCRRFYAEALAVSRLDHVNLVRVHDFGQEPDGLLYLAMDFLEGRSLRDVVQRDAPLKGPRIAEIMMQVCAGLGHAHSRGIIHRDVKPDNIILVAGQDDDGHVLEVPKVCDFGLALLRSKDALRERFAGTPVYMSPEQCRGEELDARTDVYSCGVVLYELATGTVPFLSDKPIVVVNRHLSMPPPPMTDHVPGVDPRLERIVQRALKKSRTDRYTDMRELRADLKELLRPAGAHEVFDLEAEARRIESDMPPVSGTQSIPPPGPGPSMPPMPSVTLPPPPPDRARAETMPQIPESSRQETMSRGELGRAQTLPKIDPGDTARADTMPRSDAFARTDGSRHPEIHVRPSSPPSKPPSDRPERTSNPPEWLEQKSEGYERFLHGMASGSQRGEELADVLAREPSAWLRKLAQERDPRAFQKMLAELEIALRMLARRADARALWAASSALHGLATENAQSPRGQLAAMVLRLFADPGMLAPVAERLLGQDDDARDAARTLVTGAGVAGAYAIYGARVKLAQHPQVRHPFVTTMRDLREAAWPVIRAALERIPDAALTGGHPLASDLAEDLLLCVPSRRDEAAGHLVGKFVRAREPGLCRAAAGALARLWADRAQPVLLGLLGDADDGIRVAAIVGLRELGAIDEHVVRKLAPLLRGATPAGHELRLAAVSALEVATLDARPIAAPLLAQLVRETAPDDLTVLAAARALVTIAGGDGTRAVVVERADRSPEPLRSHLLALRG